MSELVDVLGTVADPVSGDVSGVALVGVVAGEVADGSDRSASVPALPPEPQAANTTTRTAQRRTR